MKKYILCAMSLFVIVFITSCSSDENVEKTCFDSKSVQGEWFCLENATYIKFSVNAFQGEVYSNLEGVPKMEMGIKGKWVFFPTNNVLRLMVEYANSIRVENRDYKLMKLENNTLVLFDMQFNTQFTFFKVVENRTMAVGEGLDMSVDGFTPSSYSVVSTSIAKVDNTGHVEATSAGTTFIYAKNEVSAVYAKIDVLRIPGYQNDLFSTIDKVYSRLGNPDFNAFYEYRDVKNMLSRYNTVSSVTDVALNAIVYFYDDSTREISQIQIRYQDLDKFNEDVAYIKDNYYDVYRNGAVYGAYPGMMKNEFYIYPAIDDGILIFTNQLYFRQNLHY